MEGLLIAEVCREINAMLPSRRRAWRFLDIDTLVLPLGDPPGNSPGNGGALWLFNHSPEPRLALLDDVPPAGTSYSGFQDLLVARAAGDLLAVQQHKLDRVAMLRFGPSGGFVSSPEVTLVAELTGRNCNLVLLDGNGIILGAAREVRADRNRYRQVRPGLSYRLPPPYQKLDTREASLEQLAQALTGKPLRKIVAVLDGIGPRLMKVLATASGVDPAEVLTREEVERLWPFLQQLVAKPSQLAATYGDLDPRKQRKRQIRDRLLADIRSRLGRRRALLQKRLGDIERAEAAAAEAPNLRLEADLLLTYQHLLPERAEEATLMDADGVPRRLKLDPKLSAVANAERRYAAARKRQRRAEQAAKQRSSLEAERKELGALEAGLERMSEDELRGLLGELSPGDEKRKASLPGVRYRGPHDLLVVVGRNARENDLITFRLARSRDLWFHVQGYRGAHVVVLAGGREVPFDTVLFAAQLAAAYSGASQSQNVPVDYTLRKNVWRAKGGGLGAVHYARQKTVYVTPNRRPDSSSG